ncbi:hypothetical protein BTJ40_10265 [Microbulbifer sp. A4B17]|uniref:hypothetical protein n=1 Tax=Microbulbifer sp. A4B17 TaxID=359370 RepID=UPI000D52BB80|nr:hypothetical protein [Microbulbifer sp. A4B17]AWF81171.1 hypothetical protein BTJ40_10265 [Microbulbifer sp. A4B17]
MKLNKSMILTVAVCLSGVVQASTIDKELSTENKELKVTKLRASTADFGIFKIERSLSSVPSSIAAPERVVSTKGEMAIVNIADDSATDVVGKGTVVRNTMTDELTTLTGNITILLNKNVNASDVASVAGMEVLSVFPGTDIAILKIKEGNDLLEAFNAIKQSGLAIESRVEVTETIHEAQ